MTWRGVTSRGALIAIVTTASCGACSRGASVGSPAVQRPVATPPSATVMTLERKPCYGTCPVYLVSVIGDGSVVFEGRAHVDSARRLTSRISPDQVAALIRLFDDNQFYTLADKYVRGAASCPDHASDAPTVITSITTKDRAKRIDHDLGCANVPKQLAEVERRFDEIVGTSRWIGRH